MKGILFVEFIDFLETNASEEEVQEIINKSDVKSGGAYSRVGLYDYQELIALLVQSASSLEKPAEELLDGFAEHLIAMFATNYSDFFKTADCAVDMLQELDSHIHVEVKKLYPDAELPKFITEQQGDELHLHYQSPRPLAGVALSLTKACIKHFDQGEKITDIEVAEDQCSAKFVVKLMTAQV